MIADLKDNSAHQSLIALSVNKYIHECPLYDHLGTDQRLSVSSKWREGLLCVLKLTGDISLLLLPNKIEFIRRVDI